MKRLLLMGFAALFAACGGSSGGGGGFPVVEVAYVTVSPETASFNRIGQRQQLSATAWDADDNPIPGVAFSWESSDPSIMVDSVGLATALSAGSADVMATDLASEDGQSGSAALAATTAIASDRGIMYTAWTARSGYAPALIENGRLQVPGGMIPDEPAFPSPWPHPGVEKFQWEGDRIGILTDMAGGVGTFRVMDRHEEWTLLGKADVVHFQLENNRIAVLHDDGRFRVKEGIHGPWTTLANGGIKHFQLSGNRIGELNDQGRFRVKEGIHGKWTVLANAGIKHFQLTGSLTGELNDNGRFRVKQGTHGPWTVLAQEGVSQFKLAGNRIAVLHEDGRFRVKDGIHGTWRLLASGGVLEFQLSGNLIGERLDDGRFRVKEGLDGIWRVLAEGGIRLFQLQSPYIAEVTDGGLLRVKQGVDGVWTDKAVNPDLVTQIQPIVAVPDPPWRTTPATYNRDQQQCINDEAAGYGCDHVSSFAVPVAHYGRFCGAGVPSNDDLNWARGAGPIDAFDNLCRHHDNASFWYPEEVSDGAFDACVVRYGIVHARLTHNGSVLSAGTAKWNWAWDFMPNLEDAIYNYDWYTSGCGSNKLDQFTQDTASVW